MSCNHIDEDTRGIEIMRKAAIYFQDEVRLQSFFEFSAGD